MGDPLLDLSLTEDQQKSVQEWHAFADEVIRPVAAEHDRAESTPMDVLEEAAKRGLYSLDFWAAGREDPTGLHWLLASEELFWGCAGIALQLTVSGLALAGLSSAGTPEQLIQWGPECFGSPGDIKLGALAVTEPDAGSDVASLQTTARRDGSDWVLDGHKMFIGNGGIADVHVVVATVDPDLGHHGQASFVVPKGTPGLVPIRRLSKLGLRAAYTGEFRLEDCRIPAEHLLGGQDKLDEKLAAARGDAPSAGSSTLKALERSRPVVAAQAIGVARAAYEYALEYACERRTFGVPIIDHPPVAELLADMALEIDAARLLAWRAAWMGATDRDYQSAEGSMSKLKASEVATRVTEKAVQILGGHGYLDDHPVEKWYRDAKVFDIYEGTSQIQRMVIARSLPDADSPLPLRRGHG
ncbi:MAG: acyl-CoA dehydrogenase [Actinomycetota bacterium]|jgi:acyl-CoA dehydrogenase|nr:acyl-CoA dehydrogenase [Actinomycetota bacterium]